MDGSILRAPRKKAVDSGNSARESMTNVSEMI